MAVVFHFMLLLCLQVRKTLQQQWRLSEDVARLSCDKFLRLFRQCPDHADFELDEWRTLLWATALGEDFQHLAGDIYHIWKKLRYTFLTFEEPVINLISALRKHKYSIGLITNGPSRSQWEKIVETKAEDLFDSILVSGDLPCEKPQPEIFQLACQQLNVSPSRCCMIGDRIETDILGGKLAGLAATLWIPLNPSDKTRVKNEKPDFTIDSLLELAPLFGVNSEEIRV